MFLLLKFRYGYELNGGIMNNILKKTGEILERKKQMILYGVPGVGKTHFTNKFKEYVRKENCKFITFHQSFAYEEFIEGLRPKNDENGNIVYEIEDGILKKMCILAIWDVLKSKECDENNVDIEFNELIEKFKEKYPVGSKLETITGGRFEITNYNDNKICIILSFKLGYGVGKIVKDEDGKITTMPIIGKSSHVFLYSNLERLWNDGGNVNNIQDIITDDIQDIIGILGKDNVKMGYYYSIYDELKSYYYSIYKELKQIYDKLKESKENKENNQHVVIKINNIVDKKHVVINIDNTHEKTYKKVKEKVMQELKEYKKSKNIFKKEDFQNAPKYYLIIDEINRGNISNIFGELITLLEKDKRLGEDNEIITELPYSKEPFAVPSNLYIIGTMNTADKSIALLDVALRRRFGFLEIEPNYELLKDKNIKGINLSELLKTINTKITLLKDRDHRIGHSYFLNIEDIDDLKFVWYNEIIPLLMEYFYNDWECLKEILKDFVNGEKPKININSDLIDDDLKLYEIKELTGAEFINTLNSVINPKSIGENNGEE
ncbi:MAG: 5-methylcytosine-specific restriction enzyme [Methanothermococcus sp.]|jgi:5-methylcytosine-specific restriction protein B|nr:5-methylcytosine-specific restriction enzyme [Methanothermococcus sp.]